MAAMLLGHLVMLSPPVLCRLWGMDPTTQLVSSGNPLQRPTAVRVAGVEPWVGAGTQGSFSMFPHSIFFFNIKSDKKQPIKQTKNPKPPNAAGVENDPAEIV